MHPLCANVEKRAVVVRVDDGNAKANAGTHLRWTIVAVHLYIRSGVRNACAIVYAIEEIAAKRRRAEVATKG